MNELLRQLNEERRKARFLYLVYGVLMLAFLGFMLLDRYGAAILMAALALLLYIGAVRGGAKSYEAHYRKENIEHYLQKYFGTVEFVERGQMTAQQFSRLGLARLEGSRGFLARNQVAGNVDGMVATAVDVTFPVPSAGKNGREARRFVSGCLIVITLWEPAGGSAEEVKTRLKEGELPPEAAEAVKRLTEYTTGPVRVKLQGGQLSCLIERRFLAGRAPSYKRNLSEQDLWEDQLPELRFVLEISRCIRAAAERTEEGLTACM